MRQLLTLIVISACMTNAFSQGIGIGTNTPHTSAILELKSSTKGLLFPRTSTVSRIAMTGIKGLMVYDTTLSQLFYHTGTGWQQVTSGPHPPLTWHVSQIDDDDIFNNNSGTVGIGFADQMPTYKLSVNGTVYVQDAAKTTIRLNGTPAATEARILWELPSNTMDYNITQYLNSLYISRTTGSLGFVNDLVVTNNGYIGIGTNAPETKLNIIGGTDVGNGSGGFLQLGANNSINIGFDNNEIQARNNGVVTRLHLNNGGGTVQIGNVIAPSTYSLAVNGKIICEELKIQDSNDWADYVFADGYSLKSFDDLRNFINTHHHLPNIPDAKTIEINGIEVGEMQKRMMEKIEELTLYMLQLEEKIRLMERTLEASGINHK
ncbi:MAG TPA: hypothetical protein VI603_06875 [Saprospiraceae bacterium]|nr:hypothetical protein [Saprospiraceae bacterium]